MPFCTNCGASINNKTKFCPNCGFKIGITPKNSSEPSKKKMEKGVVKSLKNETSNYVKSKIKETVSPKTQKDNLYTHSEIKTDDIQIDNNNTINTKKTAKNLILFYVLLNILLFSFGEGSDDIMGVKFFSVIILVIYFIRHQKEKPLNWLLKIFIGLQAILLFSIFITQSQYLFVNFISFLTTLSLLGLFIIILLLLFKGNKTQ
ncbi:hypothetical protein Lupro_07090 [Lutibacter profundi]|uniref:Zinc-ribbon domain-containing protein n=1 Tax=Lutibacter profundi TaxID=1622118 RepID=A0A0X8G6M7_9FLAO|nr:zinc ribbon domain-containing protein [Lutibacter profundi]AMC11025.1 hypothetical protein Lupro_07090 [Lutibacter profundi]